MGLDVRPIDRRTVGDCVYDQLADQIVSGARAAGSTLPAERLLAERFGVGRSAVREALQRLAQAGLIEIRQGESTKVRDPRRTNSLDLLSRFLLRPDGKIDAAVLRSIIETRQTLGEDAARRCAQRAPPELAAGLRDVADRIEATNDLDLLGELDEEFWRLVVAGSENLVYRLAFNGLMDAYAPVRRSLAVFVEAELRNTGGHRGLAEAVSRRDTVGAHAAAHELLASSRGMFDEGLRRLEQLQAEPRT